MASEPPPATAPEPPRPFRPHDGKYEGGPGGPRLYQPSRKNLDPAGAYVRMLKDRILRPEARLSPCEVSGAASASSIDVPLPAACLGNASSSVCARFMHSTSTKDRCPIYSICWTADGRRVLAGGQTGMFTLWSGVNFSFEIHQQGHENAVRAMQWSQSGEWLISADHDGAIKYWASTLNNVKEISEAHTAAVRALSFCPTDAKFVSGSDDAALKIWDFERGALERTLAGTGVEGGKSHNWDIKCAVWHPERALIASGSKDNAIKLWDPKAAREICTLFLHKNWVNCMQWHPSGNFFASGSRDQLVKLFDLRAMRESAAFKAHRREVTSLAWHPQHAELFASGGYDGSLYYWSTLEPEAYIGQSLGARGFTAHEKAIWALSWHPLGHLLCSGSEDNMVKFWSRNRPGDGRKREREEGDDAFDDEFEMRLQQLQ